MVHGGTVVQSWQQANSVSPCQFLLRETRPFEVKQYPKFPPHTLTKGFDVGVHGGTDRQTDRLRLRLRLILYSELGKVTGYYGEMRAVLSVQIKSGGLVRWSSG